jgi:hypothetical protein
MNYQVYLHFLDLVDGSVAASIARSFGINLDNLRIQLNSEVAVAFGARAFAYGDQIHFAPGEFDRSTAEGWRIVGHELAHVVQQRLGRVPQIAGIIDDPELEREAHAAGDLAASVFATGRVPATPFYPGPIPAKAHRCAVQCLMSLTDFKTETVASGPRSKVKKIDDALEALHTLDKKTPRNYVTLLAKLRSLSTACKTYLRENPKSDRKGGIDRLERQIALEEVVLAPLADYYAGKADLMKAWEHLEQAQDKVQDVQSKPEFKRRFCDVEIQGLIDELEGQIRVAKYDAKMVLRDIDQLRKLADLEGLPPILKSIIQEATNAANTRQIDFKIREPGSGYNISNGGTGPKYTLRHRLGQVGRKWRMGSLLHELTHISIAEIFDNTLMMLAIRKDADDDEMIQFARLRRAKIIELQRKINAANDLDPALQREMQVKANYPLNGVLQRYMSDFRRLFSDSDFKRFAKLGQERKMDGELIEYDTVINQMALWCALSKIDEKHAVYRELLTLAREAYQYRAIARGAPPRVLVRTNSMSSMQPQRVGAGLRRGSL